MHLYPKLSSSLPITPVFAPTLCAQLDLSGNNLGPEGAAALAPAIAVCASLTSLIIYSNQLGDEGMGAIANALKDSTVSQLASLDVRNNQIGPKGAEALAAWLAVSASVTKILVSSNRLGDAGTTILCDAVEGRSGLELKL